MPKRKLPFLNYERDRHGVRRYYVRVRHGRRIAIPGEYLSPEFMAAYRDAIAGAPQPSARQPKGTMNWLVARWRESSDWSEAAMATRRQRENILKHVLEKIGRMDCTEITKADIRQSKDARKDTPAAANNFLKTMRALFRWAVEDEILTDNPAEGVPLFKLKKGGHQKWTVEEVQQFRDFYPLGTRPRLALEIAINTGLRRGDIVRIGRQHLRNGVIEIRTEKTGVQLFIPVLPKLQEALEAGPVGDLVFLCSERTGKSLAKESFGNSFREWCMAAGIKKRVHGLRKLCATIIADDGASELELQALFGWLTNNQSAIYTAEANKKRLALQAALRLIEAEGDEEEDEEEQNENKSALTFPKSRGMLKKRQGFQ